MEVKIESEVVTEVITEDGTEIISVEEAIRRFKHGERLEELAQLARGLMLLIEEESPIL